MGLLIGGHHAIDGERSSEGITHLDQLAIRPPQDVVIHALKPFEPIELLARMEALLRRVPFSPPIPALEVYQFGDISVDTLRAEVTRDRAPIDLPPREYKLLCYLIRHRGATISRNQLLDEVWGYDAMITTRTVDVHVAGLRQKIETDPRHPRYLLTIHGLGYKFIG